MAFITRRRTDKANRPLFLSKIHIKVICEEFHSNNTRDNSFNTNEIYDKYLSHISQTNA